MIDMHNIPVGFHFQVDFGVGTPGIDHRFQEVSGLGAEITTEDLKEGGADVTYKLPTGIKYNNLVLKRGMIFGSEVRKWCEDAIELFDFKPTDVTVVLLNEDHAPIATWQFIGAWPVKWSVSDFKAQDNSLVIESIELTYRQMRKIT
jgi:phage tail-like protein